MESIRRERELKFIAALAKFATEVEDASSRVLHDKIFLRCTDLDKIRLFKIQLWSWQYKLPVEFIVRELLTYWKERMPKRIVRQRGRLGVRIATLTNEKAHQHLTLTLEKTFPNRENEKEWRIAKQSVYVPRTSDSLFEVDDPVDFMKQYKERVSNTRRSIEATTRRLTKRKFRNNPFV